MRGSLNGVGTKVERLAQRLRLVSEQDLAQRVTHMTDRELEEHRQDLHLQSVRLIERVAGRIVATDIPDKVAERFCRRVTTPGAQDFVVATAREHLARLRWFNLHAAHGTPKLVSLADQKSDAYFGRALVVTCPCVESAPSWDKASGTLLTHLELVPDWLRREVEQCHGL